MGGKGSKSKGADERLMRCDYEKFPAVEAENLFLYFVLSMNVGLSRFTLFQVFISGTKKSIFSFLSNRYKSDFNF